MYQLQVRLNGGRYDVRRMTDIVEALYGSTVGVRCQVAFVQPTLGTDVPPSISRSQLETTGQGYPSERHGLGDLSHSETFRCRAETICGQKYPKIRMPFTWVRRSEAAYGFALLHGWRCCVLLLRVRAVLVAVASRSHDEHETSALIQSGLVRGRC